MYQASERPGKCLKTHIYIYTNYEQAQLKISFYTKIY